ncbi:MAG: hypothetical protein K2I51_07675, partial [Muribaculaceae bacterium]|nr:hypothetical protein [Muribaculaceae bacterium]
MDSYNYSPNGIDYDPDRLYIDEDGPGSRAAGRRAMRDGRQSRERELQEQPAQRAASRRRERAASGRREAAPADGFMPERESSRQRQQEPSREASVRGARATGATKAEARKKEKKEKKERVPLRELGIVKFILDRRTRAVLGVALICVAVYVAIAAISWIRSGSEDQSVVVGLTVGEVVASGAQVSNNGGPLGAAVSEAIFARGLGLGSLVGLVYIVLLGLALMGIRKCSFWSLTFKSLLVAVTASLVLGLVTLWCGSDISLGGDHGMYMNLLIQSYANWIG